MCPGSSLLGPNSTVNALAVERFDFKHQFYQEPLFLRSQGTYWHALRIAIKRSAVHTSRTGQYPIWPIFIVQRKYRSGPLLTDRSPYSPLGHTPRISRPQYGNSKFLTSLANLLFGTKVRCIVRRTLRVLRRAARSRAREEHPEASISLWEPGFLPNFSLSYLLCGKLRLIR